MVICQPNTQLVGQTLRFSSNGPVATPTVSGSGWQSGQTFGGESQLVVRRPVRGTNWQVAVHSNFRKIREQLDVLRSQATEAAIPALMAFVALGTIVARALGRRYERRVEQVNVLLDSRVRQRTLDLEAAFERNRQLIEAAPSAIFVCDDHDRILDANSLAAQLVGTVGMHLTGQIISDILQWRSSGIGTMRGFREAELSGGDGARIQLHIYTKEILSVEGRQTIYIAQDVT